ncbi:MAG: ABC transporter permease [Actinobacteria bacterium]|nr:ABC transporter permease [Actinomycetota bacterium]
MARRFDYFLRETVSGLRRNGLVTFAAVSTVFISLFLGGGALLINRQANLMLEFTTNKVEVAVYLEDGISLDQQNRIQGILNRLPEVASVDYESKEEAYGRFKVLFANQPDLVLNVSADALPASFRVKLADPEKFESVRAVLQGEPGIEKISDQRELLRQFFAIANVFKFGVGAVAIIMLVSASGLIANTVRMALFARRKEIGIMKLVGATNWFIRVPFLIEGMVQGLIGAGAAVVGLFVIKLGFVDPLRNQIGFVPILRNADMMFAVPILLGVGVLVAGVASLIAMRRFLDV